MTSIYLFCDECENNEDFLMWYTEGADAIIAVCQKCEAIEVWRNL